MTTEIDEPPPGFDDVRTRIDELDYARRHLGRSIAGKGITLQRILRRRDTPTPALLRFDEHPEGAEVWPRRVAPPPRRSPRPALIVFLVVVVLVGAAFLQHRGGAVVVAGVQTRASAPEKMPVETAAPAAASPESIVVRMNAVGPCRVRIVVDGTALDWRELKQGDEFVLRPTRAIFVETDDASALAATVNAESVNLDQLNALFPKSGP